MKKIFFVLLFFYFPNSAHASIKENIIKNLVNTKNLSFKFEQNTNGNIEKGNCIIEYPKKIFCKYKEPPGKVLISNGRSLVIKTRNDNYYRYSIKRTPLNYILDKKFLINEIETLKERLIDKKFVQYKIFIEENEINIFFDRNNFDLVGWQTLDIYQNLNITYLSFLKKNQILNKNIFKLP